MVAREGRLLLNALWKGPQRRAFCPGPLLLVSDAREHSDSAGCTVQALSLFIPLVSTCTSSQKVLCPIETSLEPGGYLVALSAPPPPKKKQPKIVGLLFFKWIEKPKGKAESDQNVVILAAKILSHFPTTHN